MTRKRLAIAAFLFVLCAAAALWAIFLVHQGLSRADQWSSIASVALTVAFGIAGVIASRTSGTQQKGHTQRGGKGSSFVQVAGDVLVDASVLRDDQHEARAVIDFLTDRRVLTQPLDRENPEYCIKSAIKIRDQLTSILGRLGPNSDLRDPILRIREAASRFCTDAQTYLDAGGNLYIGLPVAIVNIDPETGVEVKKTFDNHDVPDFEESLTAFRHDTALEMQKIAESHPG